MGCTLGFLLSPSHTAKEFVSTFSAIGSRARDCGQKVGCWVSRCRRLHKQGRECLQLLWLDAVCIPSPDPHDRWTQKKQLEVWGCPRQQKPQDRESMGDSLLTVLHTFNTPSCFVCVCCSPVFCTEGLDAPLSHSILRRFLRAGWL